LMPSSSMLHRGTSAVTAAAWTASCTQGNSGLHRKCKYTALVCDLSGLRHPDGKFVKIQLRKACMWTWHRYVLKSSDDAGISGTINGVLETSCRMIMRLSKSLDETFCSEHMQHMLPPCAGELWLLLQQPIDQLRSVLAVHKLASQA